MILLQNHDRSNANPTTTIITSEDSDKTKLDAVFEPDLEMGEVADIDIAGIYVYLARPLLLGRGVSAAVHAVMEGLKLAEKVGAPTEELALLYGAASMISNAIGKFSQAVSYANMAYGLAFHIGAPRLKAAVLEFCALGRFGHRNWSEVFYMVDSAEALIRDIGDSRLHEVLATRMMILMYHGNLDGALDDALDLYGVGESLRNLRMRSYGLIGQLWCEHMNGFPCSLELWRELQLRLDEAEVRFASNNSSLRPSHSNVNLAASSRSNNSNNNSNNNNNGNNNGHGVDANGPPLEMLEVDLAFSLNATVAWVATCHLRPPNLLQGRQAVERAMQLLTPGNSGTGLDGFKPWLEIFLRMLAQAIFAQLDAERGLENGDIASYDTVNLHDVIDQTYEYSKNYSSEKERSEREKKAKEKEKLAAGLLGEDPNSNPADDDLTNANMELVWSVCQLEENYSNKLSQENFKSTLLLAKTFFQKLKQYRETFPFVAVTYYWCKGMLYWHFQKPKDAIRQFLKSVRAAVEFSIPLYEGISVFTIGHLSASVKELKRSQEIFIGLGCPYISAKIQRDIDTFERGTAFTP